MTPFQQQANFMECGGQTVGQFNILQADRYIDHIHEEARETSAAWDDYFQTDEGSIVKVIDGAVDTIVVCIGLLHSLGIDPQKAWDAVYKSNMSKFNDGKPVYRADGQIGKGENYKSPDEDLTNLAKEVGLIK